jgi:ubiquitin-conjugating enzyme E2 O
MLVKYLHMFDLLNITDHGYRPGDCVLWKGEEEKRVAIVQSVLAKDRVARVRWYGTNTFEDVSVLELDPHGMSYENTTGGPDSFGVRRGETVLIHREGTTNGLKEPLVPRIGELEPWVQELPPSTVDGNGNGNVEDWRKSLTNSAMKVLGFDWSRREDETQQSLPNNSSWVGQVVDVMSGSAGLPGRFEAPSLSAPDEIDWFGQVVDVSLFISYL